MSYREDWKKSHPWVVVIYVPLDTPLGRSRVTLHHAFATESEADEYIDWARTNLAIGLVPRTETWNWRDVESVQSKEGRWFKTLATCSPGRKAKQKDTLTEDVRTSPTRYAREEG